MTHGSGLYRAWKRPPKGVTLLLLLPLLLPLLFLPLLPLPPSPSRPARPPARRDGATAEYGVGGHNPRTSALPRALSALRRPPRRLRRIPPEEHSPWPQEEGHRRSQTDWDRRPTPQIHRQAGLRNPQGTSTATSGTLAAGQLDPLGQRRRGQCGPVLPSAPAFQHDLRPH